MAGQLLHLVIDGAIEVIKATTPDYEPATTYRLAPQNGPLEVMSFGSPSEDTRIFHVLPGSMVGQGGPQSGMLNGTTLHHLHDQIVVRMRYHCPLRDGGYGRLLRLIASDGQRIFSALTTATEADWGSESACPSEVQTLGVSAPIAVGDGAQQDTADAWLVEYSFAVQTFLEKV